MELDHNLFLWLAMFSSFTYHDMFKTKCMRIWRRKSMRYSKCTKKDFYVSAEK